MALLLLNTYYRGLAGLDTHPGPAALFALITCVGFVVAWIHNLLTVLR